MNFDKLIALVTGGARGIGLACVRALLQKGSRVVINDCSVGKLEETRKKLLQDESVSESLIMTISTDVTDAHAVEEMFDQVMEKWGPVMALVNNAGVSGGRKSLSEISDEEWDSMLIANLRGVYLCTKRVLPHMYKNRWGRIVNIASIAGVSGKLLASAHYSAAKGGIVAFTKRIAIEAAPYNVAVNCIAPGLIADTGFTHNIKGKLLEQYLAGIPAQRAGRCEEIGELVAFLCSPYAGYIIGQTILIDGGAST